MRRYLTKDGKELASVEGVRVHYTGYNLPDIAELGVRWIVQDSDDRGVFNHFTLFPSGYCDHTEKRCDPFCFPFADTILRRLCHSKAQKAGWPSEWAELALDIAVPRLWSRINRDMSDVSELSYAVVLRDKAFAHVFRSLSEEREALAFWAVNRGPSRILPERPEFVPYSPSIGSKQAAYRLIGYDRLDTASYCG